MTSYEDFIKVAEKEFELCHIMSADDKLWFLDKKFAKILGFFADHNQPLIQYYLNSPQERDTDEHREFIMVCDVAKARGMLGAAITYAVVP